MANAAVTSTGTVDVTGTGAVILDAASVTATGAVSIAGASASTLEDVIGTSTGTVPHGEITGNASVTLDDITGQSATASVITDVNIDDAPANRCKCSDAPLCAVETSDQSVNPCKVIVSKTIYCPGEVFQATVTFAIQPTKVTLFMRHPDGSIEETDITDSHTSGGTYVWNRPTPFQDSDASSVDWRYWAVGTGAAEGASPTYAFTVRGR
jgi:hypothetical protein